MAQPSTSGSGGDMIAMKRKRSLADTENTEDQPPKKISSPRSILQTEEVLGTYFESSASSEEDVANRCPSVVSETVKGYTDSEYGEESSPELCSILSPLNENEARGDNTPSRRLLNRDSNVDIVPTRRKCPFPYLTWGDPTDVWHRMCESDVRSALQRSPNLLDKHPGLQPRMRAILLDWINEVCEVYKLHRETFHLTVEYIDRYLSSTEGVLKSRLQLIGITCLFIAAKVEEIYPPKLTEFAYVTDGACTTEEILAEEVLILKILTWSITPITINGWLNVYMQVMNEAKGAKRRLLGENATVNALRGYTFVFPQYSSFEFALLGQSVDLAVLLADVNCYPYSVVAAAAMAHAFGSEAAIRVSGYSWEEVSRCYQWLEAAVGVARAEGVLAVRTAEPSRDSTAGALAHCCPDLNGDESHRVQVHNIGMDMYDKVMERIAQQGVTSVEGTPKASIKQAVLAMDTPPNSREKAPLTPTTTPSARDWREPSPQPREASLPPREVSPPPQGTRHGCVDV